MKKIERVPMVQQAVDNLKEYIMSGAVKVGDKMPTEKELCEQFGVGRGTIREAMCTLQANGFVKMQPGKGAFVASTKEYAKKEIMEWFVENEVQVKDIIEVRSAIEPLAIKLAIQKATKEDGRTLELIHQKILQAIISNEVSEIGIYDEEFHTYIVKCSQNKMLISINEQICDYLKAFRGKTFQIPHNVENIVPAHTNILNAFLEGNIEAAQRFMSEHIEKIINDLILSKKYYAVQE
jgi:GntR family transcriptional repressor for pyruvate dehydrogenase complex